MGMTVDTFFVDNNWGSLNWGGYKWGIETIYNNDVSETIYSNILDKDMLATVSFEVTTNSGDAPDGCIVSFTNTSEPELNLIYEIELDVSGIATIESFRKGNYNISIVKNGF